MRRYILKRILSAIPVILVVTLISFFIISLVPGDAASVVAGPNATADELAIIRTALGLDVPWTQRMINWYYDLLTGDLGTSFLLNQPVLDVLLQRLPVTLALSVYALTLAVVIGIGTGCIAAYFQGTWIDRTITMVTLAGVSVPNFILGLGAIFVLAVKFRIFPAGGYVPFGTDPVGWLHSLTLPACVLAAFEIGFLSRITRATMVEVLQQDYIRTAQAKGLLQYQVVASHALRNVMIPVLTVIGIMFSGMMAGSIVIETVYSIPGIGRLLVDAISRRDFPVVQGVLLFVGISFVTINLAVDLLYAWFDPRISYE